MSLKKSFTSYLWREVDVWLWTSVKHKTNAIERIDNSQHWKMHENWTLPLLTYKKVLQYLIFLCAVEIRNSGKFGHTEFFCYCGAGFPATLQVYCLKSKELVIWKISANAGFSAILQFAIAGSTPQIFSWHFSILFIKCPILVYCMFHVGTLSIQKQVLLPAMASVFSLSPDFLIFACKSPIDFASTNPYKRRKIM